MTDHICLAMATAKKVPGDESKIEFSVNIQNWFKVVNIKVKGSLQKIIHFEIEENPSFDPTNDSSEIIYSQVLEIEKQGRLLSVSAHHEYLHPVPISPFTHSTSHRVIDPR